MKKMTEKNLKEAFAGESQAHMKYAIFAERAEEEGLKNVARLFRAISYAELVHAANHLRTLGQVGSSAENLQAAIDGETYEVEEMYPAFKAVADLQNELGAQRSINYALQAEKVHAGMYQQARQSVLSGSDIEIGTIYICKKCGYTVEGEAPKRCPICGAPETEFKGF
ncbi:MAG: rubrerythrin family protein [Candidatus Hadarchaeum sp.]|uniref:rubrerythrin family protein n=1 Tax=Candidatus Hadarchaeum sp. TaxID=2883567 RepID=UPI003D0AC30C